MSVLEHYGLDQPPFALTPDPRFWFESATHRKAMAYLGYGLQQGEGFVVVTGEIGAGKTTLVGLLTERLDPARHRVVSLVSSQLGAEDVLRLTAAGLGTPTAGSKAELLDTLERTLAERARAGLHTLLIVDEAQSLAHEALEELRMLSNFQGAGRPLLQILLLGQPEFRDRLARPELEQLRQRVIATHHLDGMAEAETGPYLQHRLDVAGAKGRPRFDDAAAQRIHAATGGIPRRINTLAARVLLAGALEGEDTLDAALVERVLADRAADEGGPTPEAASDAGTLALRVSLLERQVEEQEAALRRVLGLMIDWVGRDEPRAPVPAPPRIRSA